jgi:hypothetical protein
MIRSLMPVFCVANLVGSLNAADESITYTKHVAPILFKHCAQCHRAGEVGPFSLLTYKDAAKRADFIKDITASGRMPPWKAEAQEHKFVDERRLTRDERALIAKWADNGALEGDPRDLPPLPKFTEGWSLGEPDLIVKMPKAFTVPAGGRDVYRWFTLPLGQMEDRTVAAVDFRPGNRRVVHHAVLYLDTSGSARQRDPDGAGFSGFGGPPFPPAGGLGAWVPGMTPRRLPENTGMFLPAKADLVMQLHYHPSGKPEEDQSQVGFYFTKTLAKNIVGGITALNTAINIPPGAKEYKISAQTTRLKVPVLATAVFPHMHLIGKEMRVTAQLPDGSSTQLLHIKDWDFNWQNLYFFEKPIPLPIGTVVRVDAKYDNSADNPQNPNSPPKAVRWGEQTTDEMCLIAVQVMPEKPEDLRVLLRSPGNRLGAALVGGVTSVPGERKRDLKELVPANGYPIPLLYQKLFEGHDRDKDRRLSVAEIEAMPPALRQRVIDYIESHPSK